MKNLAASVHQRLLNVAREQALDFNAMAIRYANERFLHRLAVSGHRDGFVLKGATMLLVWLSEPARRTRDIDLLGFGSPTPDWLAPVFREILTTDVLDDGLAFLPESVAAEPIREDQEYLGVRLTFDAMLGKMPIAMQVDVGFGDAVFPEPTVVEVPRLLLGFPAPRLRGYAMETSIAEKFSAIVERGIGNSRMKDYYDIWLLSERFPFDERLARAVVATLERRQIPVPINAPFGLSENFAEDPAKLSQWRGFVRKAGIHDPPSLTVATARARELLSPVWDGSRAGSWAPAGPWQNRP